ncbi:MAG: HlyD family efflux transporter periplasmic adaptor subunit, partial [Elusimicrobia bacterium]|nr:HlyD family efflux transporter periplasmic adaptor subunit [Elusimicrobiota bacterium]
AEEGLSPPVKILENERRMDEASQKHHEAKLKKSSSEKTLQQLQNDLDVEERNRQVMEIRAPVAGVVTELKVRNPQEYVQTGQVLAVLAREKEPLIAKIQISSKDSGHLKLGLPVRVKADPFPFQDYGTLSGRIAEISPDARTHERDGSVYYDVIVELESDRLRFGARQVQVKRGQTVGAEIVVDRMPVIMVLLKPFRRLKGQWSIAAD